MGGGGGGGSKIAPKKGRYRVGQGRSKMAKKTRDVINERSLRHSGDCNPSIFVEKP